MKKENSFLNWRCVAIAGAIIVMSMTGAVFTDLKTTSAVLDQRIEQKVDKEQYYYDINDMKVKINQIHEWLIDGKCKK